MLTMRQMIHGMMTLILWCGGGTLVRADTVHYQSSIVEVRLPVSGAKYVPVTEAHLDEQTQKAMALLEAAAADHPDVPNLPPLQRRAAHDAMYMPLGLPREDLVDVEEKYIPVPGEHKLRIRIYTPRQPAAAPLPVMLYYHGGGMMVGSLEQYDPIVQRLCHKSGMLVVAVDYRMSPEYKFPTAVDDSYAALQWAHANAGSFGGDPSKMIVAGDSAGGMLTAVMTQMARDENGPQLAFQILIYPAVGTRGNSQTLDRYAHGYVFGRAELEWAYGSWINSPEEMDNPRVQPILAEDFSGLPPAYVVSAEYEVMRDDIEEYALLLQQAGVPTRLHRFEGTVHPFMSMAGVIDAGREVIDEAAAMARKGLSLPPL